MNIDKVGSHSKILLSIILLGSLFLSPPLALAQECDPVYVYGGVVTITLDYPQDDCYFNITVTGVPVDSYIPQDGEYNGWCVDTGATIYPSLVYGESKMYCSIRAGMNDTSIPECIRSASEWNKTNYILTNYLLGLKEPYISATVGDIQQILWHYGDDNYDYINSPEPSSPEPYNTTRIGEIISDADANGEDFVPSQNEYMAIIVDPHRNTGEDPCKNQVIIIPFQIPFCYEVPELPLGTITAVLTPLAALGAAALKKRREKK